MAKKPAKPNDDRVAVLSGAQFWHDGVNVLPHQIVWMDKAEAADMVALRFVRYALPGEAAP